MRALIVVLAGAVLLAAVSGCEEKKDTAGAPKPTKVSATVEYQLALQNARGYVPENHPSIEQIKTVLTSLDAKYPEDAKKIGDLSLQAKWTLESYGANESLLAVMQNVDKAGGSYPDYATALNAYVAKRKPPGR
jgi:hypothetical protein